jgi:hypothetical protein
MPVASVPAWCREAPVAGRAPQAAPDRGQERPRLARSRSRTRELVGSII